MMQGMKPHPPHPLTYTGGSNGLGKCDSRKNKRHVLTGNILTLHPRKVREVMMQGMGAVRQHYSTISQHYNTMSESLQHY